MMARTPDTSRRTDVLHPSEIIKKDFCARASYFTLIGYPVPKEVPGLRLQSIFDTGHGAHAKWQGYLRDMGVLHGKWRCDDCMAQWWATSPKECPICGHSRNIEYKEVPLVNEALMIAGHSDGWVVGLGDPFLIEIKTIGTGTIRMENPSLFAGGEDLNGAWKNIRRPFPSHIRQGLLYLELLKRMAEDGLIEGPVPTEIVFLYELKADQSYKEFVVKADTEIVRDVLDVSFDIVHSVNTKTPPPCSVDPKNGCKACKGLAA